MLRQLIITLPYHILKCRHIRRITSTTNIVTKPDLSAGAYQPKLVEKKKVYENWEKYELFAPECSSSKPTFSMVLPPPNVTGKLHLGHALSCTIQDVIMRHKRSTGHNCVWLPGTDHAGIATQGVVEKHLKTKQDLTRHALGRDKFIKEVWKWKETHGDTICKQLRIMGNSLDWSRQVFTLDAKHTLAVNTAFIHLFRKGLIYRKKSLVNWCNALKSTVSDIEVENVTLKGPKDIMIPGYEKPVKFGMMYYFAYKLNDSDDEIVVATTMPETMLGDTAIAVNPEDERYKHLRNCRVIHPFRNDTIPIIFDEFVDMEVGTGAVKITPAHSRIDHEIAAVHNLPMIQVFDEEGLIMNSGRFNRSKRYDCRETVVNILKEMDLLRNVKPHQVNLPICSRTGDVVDQLPKEQWFMSCSELNAKACELLERGRLKIEPEKHVASWLRWTADNRDWCISRQLWWGHQIPAYKCSLDLDVVWVAATSEEQAKQQASKILRAMPDSIKAERDSDVLDTWFSSGIYPFAALGWPRTSRSQDFRQFYPLNLMTTGHDILGFWVHKMVILGLEVTGQLPFNKVLLHGIICDSKGAKMSKSRGNVIDPMDVIEGISLDKLKDRCKEMHRNGLLTTAELDKALVYHHANYANTKGIPECGVDALRFTLLSQDIKSHFVNFDVAMCHANKLFCNKIWQSLKYTSLSYRKLDKLNTDVSAKDLTYFDKWILSRLAEMVDVVNRSMDSYDFHLATKAIRHFFYNEFCDVYLEATKPGFDSLDLRVGYAHAHTLSACLNTSLRCLAPFMVYLTEELIPKVPSFSYNFIHNYNDATDKYWDFPLIRDWRKWKDPTYEKKVACLLNTVKLIREMKGLYNISNKTKPCVYIKTDDTLLASDIIHNKTVVCNLSQCSDITFEKDSRTNYVTAMLDADTEVNVQLVGEDVEIAVFAAKSKLEKKIKMLEDSLSKLEAKFSSGHYLTHAPEWTQIVDKERMLSKKRELQELQRLM
ncbi:unnamed protein product [Chrysodeixis includens]|uniref:valine--tRNA ligase n=1 Tax=Chrysodeixis includens TaxID=689277 RepID=A0A9P0BVW6_CHRIL|nr:unnamed protein product [Chrysodeixis includens]